MIPILVAVIALGVERVRRVREHDKGHDTTNSTLVGCFSNRPVNALWSLIGRQAQVLEIPSIEGLIESADRGLWTSTTLDHMPEIHPELTWVPLCESVFDDILHCMSWKWDKSHPLAGVFDKLKSQDHANHISSLADSRRRLFKNEYLVNGIRRLPTIGTSSKKQGKGLRRVKAAWLVGKKPCIPVTREELVALSLMMGMPITRSNNGQYSGIGAYGLSFDLAYTDAIWKLSLAKGSRIPRHAPSMGSGYTSLMAKHLACGSILFGESGDWIRSVYVTEKVLDAVKNGLCIMDTRAYGGPSLEFLRRLPGDKAIDAYYGLANEHGSDKTGLVLDAKGTKVSKWADRVAGIAFGGLVPQADRNAIEAVKFTVAGNLDGCVQNLEDLVDALQKDSLEDQKSSLKEEIFGERVLQRTSATGHIYVNYDYPSSEKNPRDAASTFARYMNLLEHVLARSRITDKAVHDLFESTAALLNEVYQAAVKDKQVQDGVLDQKTMLNHEEQQLVEEDLGKSLKSITKSLSNDDIIEMEDAAKIVRCILAAWADTVPQIDVMEHAPVRADPLGYESGAGMIYMDAFPSVMALG